MAYYQVEPFGEFRQDLRFARLWCLLANVYRDSKQHLKPFTVMDFLEMFQEAQPPDAEGVKQKLDSNLKRFK